VFAGEFCTVLQKKVEESLKKARTKANKMLSRQSDLLSVLHVLDASIKYGDDNDAHLTAEARDHKSHLHHMRSMCMCFLVCTTCLHKL